jgi:hypothetical protein
MKKILSILFVLLVLVGCARPLQFRYTNKTWISGAAQPVKIYVDKEFGMADVIEMQKALDQWNYVFNGMVKLEIVSVGFDMSEEMIKESSDGLLILKIDSKNPNIPKGDAKDGVESPVLAFVNEVGGRYMYIIRDRVELGDMRAIMLHEMGHLLGAGHVGEHLMHPRYLPVRYQCVDAETVKAVALHWKIPVERMNYCQYY